MQCIDKTEEGAFTISAKRAELELLRDTIRDYLMLVAEIPCAEAEWREEKAVFAELTEMLG